MKKSLLNILFYALLLFVIAGCASEEEKEAKAAEVVKEEYNLVEFLTRVDQEDSIEYALDQDTNLYRYKVMKDDNYNFDRIDLILVAENTGGIREYILGSKELILTNNDELYVASSDTDWDLRKYLDDVKLYMIDDPNDEYKQYNIFNVFVLTNSGELYGFGSNRSYEIGTGHDSQVSEPYLILNNVREAFLGIVQQNYYSSVALTNDNELYVWGFKGATYSDNFEFRVDTEINSPTKKLDNVEKFTVNKDGVLAFINDEEILVNEDTHLDELNEKANQAEKLYK